MSDEWSSRVLITDRAADLLGRLVARHGPVMFHQSGGCCDGSAPMCYPDGDFIVGDRDVLLGVITTARGEPGAPVWISGSQYALWKHTQLILDAVPGRGSGFSLEAPEGERFLTRSRVISPEVEESLPPIITGGQVEEGAELPEPIGPVEISGELGEVCRIVRA
ncbi:DUF779 domain-containing protein [Naumannella halotolerans]|uniref:DUF779 domain-containing protein n=1 Tax=Naumannella halotolerans TaxID=993414 RepID=A0A4R7JAG1_9ACTN|nr:DUF779 domain-containing protein [Naumannella halotolerans]TDT34562.1 hypothetical protein CLV29_2234 [Naumannella halotolerans]